MIHPLIASAVQAAARDTGATAKGKNRLRRDMYSCTSTGACRFHPLSHEMFGRAGPVALSLLNVQYCGVCGKLRGCVQESVLENVMRDLYTTLCRGIMR